MIKPVKSLLISGVYFPPQTGGISNFMASVASNLGPERVCCLTGARSHGEEFKLNGVKVYRRHLAFKKQGLGQGLIKTLMLCETIGEIIIREKPKIVQLSIANDGYLALWLKKFFRLPFVIYAHGNEISRAAQSAWRKPLLSLHEANRVLACSHYTASLLQKVGVPQQNIEIVSPGCNVMHYQPSAPNPKLRKKLLGSANLGRIILSVGNLVARKGHDMVIRALPIISKRFSDVTYLIVGDGPYRRDLESLAVALGVQGKVIFSGRVNEADLAVIYNLCDVFVMPSRQEAEDDVEGFGMVYLEANACRKAVVGGRSGGVADAVVDGETGILVDPYDVDDIAEGICRLLLDSQLCTSMAEKGYKRVHEKFTWGHISQKIQGILESVVQESGSI